MSAIRESTNARFPWVAMALTMCCPGLGQLYCGRAARGLMMFGSFALFGPLVVGMSLVATSTASLWLFMACVLIYLIAAVWIALDAKRIAQQMSGQDYSLRDYNQLAVYVLLSLSSMPYSIGLAFFLRANVMEAFVIPTRSMAPTLIPGDRILTNKLGISTHTFSRGDVVVFRNPGNRRQNFVKRIAGLPGDTIEAKEGKLLINGESLHRDPDSTVSNPMPTASTQTVPAGSYFVLGDNRDHSHDSRAFGFLSHGEITGIVTYLYWPAQTWSRFGSVK